MTSTTQAAGPAQLTETTELRAAITGLLRFTAAEEEILLAAVAAAGATVGAAAGSPDCWAARPAIAHSAEFRRQQVIRLEAVRRGETPPAFADIDHCAAEVYLGYAAVTAAEVAASARSTTDDLIDALSAVADEDLLDPARNPWLTGRPLWLQVIVRGFWHPTGHLGEYYLGHGQPDRALRLYSHAVATASYLRAPAAAQGMACYLLGCTQAVLGRAADALATLERAISLNGDLRARLAGEPDLAGLRDDGRFSALLG